MDWLCPLSAKLALRHAQAVVKDQRAVILRQKRIIRRQGFLPLHDPHMAAAGAGLDVAGINHADLKLDPWLCRLLEMRFAGVMDIPAGESRRTSVASGPAASSADGPASSASLSQCPLRTLDQLRRAPLSTLTPKEQLRRYTNPKSPTAAGTCRRSLAPPPAQPYACPLPGEAGREEISAPLGSSLPQEALSDGESLRSSKTSRRTRRNKTRRLQLSSVTQPTISAFSEDDATSLSDSAYEFEMPSASDSAGPANSTLDAIFSAAVETTSTTMSSTTDQTTSPATPNSVLVTSTGQSPVSSATSGSGSSTSTESSGLPAPASR
ncbi:hypothetical protein PC120_g13526 [Phytophthora cactorum]|nr:hypothetical protein PC120_g13526 [Phytophthora cactorum]